MKSTIIAMTHEAGSQGKEVAKQVAEKLGLDLACHRAFEQQVADKLHADGGMVHRFLQGKPGLIERWKTDQEALAAYTREQVYELAVGGSVLICGWGATCLLRPIAHALCVRVCAPVAHRTAVLMEQLAIGEDEARAMIAANDAARAVMMRALGQADGDPAFVYDLVLNSARVPVAQCVAEVVRLAGEPAFRESAKSRERLAALYREAQVRAALRADFATRRVGAWVRVVADPAGRSVALEGAVQTHDQRRDTERVVAGLPWVARVENRLRVVGLST